MNQPTFKTKFKIVTTTIVGSICIAVLAAGSAWALGPKPDDPSGSLVGKSRASELGTKSLGPKPDDPSSSLVGKSKASNAGIKSLGPKPDDPSTTVRSKARFAKSRNGDKKISRKSLAASKKIPLIAATGFLL